MFETFCLFLFQWIYKPDSASNNSQHENDLSGPIIEEHIFKNLQSSLQSEKDTVVISGWEVKDENGVKFGEYDFIIVSLPLKSIIHIEAKRSQDTPIPKNSQSKRKKNDPQDKAAEQLEKLRKKLLADIPFPASENWTYLKWIYFEKTSEQRMRNMCSDCKAHILTTDTSFDWWKQLKMKQESTKEFKTNQMSTADEVLTQTGTYLRILKYLFHQMFIQDDVLTSGKKCNQFLLLVHNIIAKLYF